MKLLCYLRLVAIVSLSIEALVAGNALTIDTMADKDVF